MIIGNSFIGFRKVTIILDTSITRTYEQLVVLANGELTQRIGLAITQLTEAAKRGENTTEKKKLYQASCDERKKRLEFIKCKHNHFFDCRSCLTAYPSSPKG